jgi:hypothetical protein
MKKKDYKKIVEDIFEIHKRYVNDGDFAHNLRKYIREIEQQVNKKQIKN